MEWNVQYRIGEVEHVVMHPSPEQAIEAACRLIDAGIEVFGIGAGSLGDPIGQDHIARIYAIWARAERPFGWRRSSSSVQAAPS